MDCVTAKQYIDLYADGMLEDEQAKELLAHASSCASCQQDLDATLALRRALGSLGDETPPLGLATSAIARAKKSRVPAIAFISAGVAAAVVAVAVTVGVLSGGSNLQRVGDTVAVADESAKAGNAQTYEENALSDTAADDTAALMMESEMADSDAATADDTAEDTAMDAPMAAADGASDTDTGAVGSADDAAMDFCFITIPPENAAFFDTVYTFVTEAGIETSQFELTFGSLMSFVIDEARFDAFVSMLSEEEIAYEGVLYPGCYVEVRYIEP